MKVINTGPAVVAWLAQDSSRKPTEYDLCNPCYQYLRARPRGLMGAFVRPQGDAEPVGEEGFVPVQLDRPAKHSQSDARCAVCGYSFTEQDRTLNLLPLPGYTFPFRTYSVRGNPIAAFAFPRDFELYTLLTGQVNDPVTLLQELLKYYTRQKEYADLAGEDVSPLTDFVAACEAILPEGKMMRDHEHDWNPDGYCRVCGRDGRV